MTIGIRPDALVARGITFLGLEHPEFSENLAWVRGGSQPRWTRTKGALVTQGNYRLRYSDRDGRGITFRAARSGHKLLLEVGDHRYRIDVTEVPSGAAIGEACLHKFLDCISLLRHWGRPVTCRLIIRVGDQDVEQSNSRAVWPPVAPWSGALDPDLLAQDPTIRYCGDLDRKAFVGRNLDSYAGRLFFTYKGTLETQPAMRGFACIGLVGNLYGIAPGKAYEGGEAMVMELGGTAFDWAGRPRGPRVVFRAIDSALDDADDDAVDGPDFVRMGRGMLLHFMSSPEARRGTYMIWTGGHAGLIRNGYLYECKPSGKGFTNERFDESAQSAVRRYDAERLRMELKKGHGPYFLSKLRR